MRLTALASACGYWREQGWLGGDPLVRLRERPAPPDTSRALSRDRVAEILGSDAPLRERVLWHMLYESSARAEEVLMLDVPDLDTGNRCVVVTRKGGAREVVAWQTGTARLLPRLLAGRRAGCEAAAVSGRQRSGGAAPFRSLTENSARSMTAPIGVSYWPVPNGTGSSVAALLSEAFCTRALRIRSLSSLAEPGAGDQTVMCWSGSPFQ